MKWQTRVHIAQLKKKKIYLSKFVQTIFSAKNSIPLLKEKLLKSPKG